jgi:hypothetical protein
VRSRWRPAIIVVALLLSTATVVGVAAFSVATSRSLASIGGCPSHIFPVRPGSVVHQQSAISIGTTTGCWTDYEEPRSTTEQEVFGFYIDPSNTRGWSLREAYSNTRYAAFRSTADPEVQADVEVTTFKAFLVLGRSTVHLAISVCRCDPREMAQ